MAETVSIPKLLGTAVYLLAWPTLLFVLAGDWRWVEGWIFSAWFVALCTICIVWLYRKDPALLAERYRRPGSGGQKGWDRLVVYAIVFGFVSWIVVMPLDVKRFGWMPRLPAWLEVCGAAMLAMSSFFLFRSFTDNTFLSPLVRIQSERKQRVVTTGVYSFVRHPMYLGILLFHVGASLALESTLLLAATLLYVVPLTAIRIVAEDKVLAAAFGDSFASYRRTVPTLLPLRA